MIYAIISDIHSNLEALNTALDALSNEKIEKYYCAGDIVGYGADPILCIEKIKKMNMESLMGNHEAGCTGFTGLSYFNDDAKSAIIWTREKISGSDIEYFGSFKFVIENDDFTITHGTLDNPESFNYMIDSYHAMKSFQLMKTRILFVGHSHIPGIFEYKNGKLGYFLKEKIILSNETKYIINIGSVGQPRDGDNRASYAVYNSEKKEIYIKRVKYNIKKAQEKILKENLPSFLASRLSAGI